MCRPRAQPNGLYKAELIHRRAPWKTRKSVELATLQWVHWFNHHRLLEPIGYIPPAEAEAKLLVPTRSEGQACCLKLKPNSLHENQGDSAARQSVLHGCWSR